MSIESLISKVREFAIKNSENDDIHGFPHVKRVYNICIKLGKKMGANLTVLKIASLLHDIGRIYEKENMNNQNHAEISAQMASRFLTQKDLNLFETDIKNIIQSIRAHSFSNNILPETLEAKLLSDSDKLDALGAIGLYRTIGFTVKNEGGVDDVIEHLENKIMKLKNLLYLDLSKKLADKRQQIIIDFYERIKLEKD